MAKRFPANIKQNATWRTTAPTPHAELSTAPLSYDTLDQAFADGNISELDTVDVHVFKDYTNWAIFEAVVYYHNGAQLEFDTATLYRSEGTLADGDLVIILINVGQTTLEEFSLPSIACADISDGTVAGCAIVTAADAAAQRAAMDVDQAGTDNSTPPACADITDSTAAGCAILTAADAAAQRAAMDVDQAGTDNSTDVTLAGAPDYITISGQVITRGQIDLAADVTGALPWGSLSGTPTTIAGYGITDALSAVVDDTTPELGGDLSTGGYDFVSPVADGAAAVGFTHDTVNDLATSGAKHSEWKNQGTELASLDRLGSFFARTVSAGTDLSVYPGEFLRPGPTQLRLMYDELGSSARFGVTSSGTLTISADDNLIFDAAGDSVQIQSKQITFVNDSNLRWYSSTSAALPVLSLSGSDVLEIGSSLITDYLIKGAGSKLGIGTSNFSADTTLDVNGGITIREQSADEADPDEGAAVFWLSDGTATGSDGEVWAKVTAGGTTNDYLVVGQPSYGIMSVQAGSTGEGTVDGTPRIITAWNTDGIESKVDVDHTVDYIQVADAGVYQVAVSISFSGTLNSTVQLELYIYDDSAASWGASGFALDRKLGTGGDVGSAGLQGLVALDPDDRIALYQSSDGSAITVTEAQLVVHKLS